MRRAEEQNKQNYIDWSKCYPYHHGDRRYCIQIHVRGRLHRTEKSWQGRHPQNRQIDWRNRGEHHGHPRRRIGLRPLLPRIVRRGFRGSSGRQWLRVLQRLQKVNCLHHRPKRSQRIYARLSLTFSPWLNLCRQANTRIWESSCRGRSSGHRPQHPPWLLLPFLQHQIANGHLLIQLSTEHHPQNPLSKRSQRCNIIDFKVTNLALCFPKRGLDRSQKNWAEILWVGFD